MNTNHEELEIKTSDTTIRYRKLGPGLFHQAVSYNQELGARAGAPSHEVSITGPTWAVVFGAKNMKGKTEVVKGDGVLKLRPYFFLPPFSIIELGFESLRVEYEGLVSNVSFPVDWPKEPIMFESDYDKALLSVEDVAELLKMRKKEVPISRASRPDEIAIKAREAIHQSYESSCSISDIALELEVDHTALTKSFTKGFGIPPIKYRNILRVHDSVRHMLFGKSSATAAAFEVGFEDLSRFNKNFKQIMEAVPSQFSFRSSSVPAEG